MKDERNNNESQSETFVVRNSILKKFNGSEDAVRLPGFIYGVGESAFAGNATIRVVSCSSNISAIGDNAFEGCTALEEVILPYEIVAIGEQAFKGCASLLQIVFNGNKERWLSIKKGQGWLEDTHDFIIICKDADITKQEEIDIESEPALNFDLSQVQADLQSKSGRLRKNNETEQSNDTGEKPTITDASGWSAENRQVYLERRRRELIERMKNEMDDDEGDEDGEDGENEQQACDDFSKYKMLALRMCVLEGQISVSKIQRKFPVGYTCACKIIDWMVDEGYIVSKGKNANYQVMITEEKFNSMINADGTNQPKPIPTFKRLLKKLTLNKKETVRNLASVLKHISKMKQDGEIANEEPSHSLWNNEEEFDAVVMERIERLVRSDLKMARRGAIKKAEAYLYAVHDTHDGKMAQVYERIVYELKTTSDGLYNQIRNRIREE